MSDQIHFFRISTDTADIIINTAQKKIDKKMNWKLYCENGIVIVYVSQSG